MLLNRFYISFVIVYRYKFYSFNFASEISFKHCLAINVFNDITKYRSKILIPYL